MFFLRLCAHILLIGFHHALLRAADDAMGERRSLRLLACEAFADNPTIRK
jgi:hypothetical protein